MKSRWVILASLGVIFLFFIVRLINLTIIPVFVDEAIYIRWAQVMRAEATLRFLPLSDGKQPLFMWLIIPFLKIFSDPLFAGRFLSVLAGLGSMAGVAFITWLLFRKKWISLLAALFYAVIPFFIFFDRLALVDSLLMTFGIWLAALGILLIHHRRLDLAMITGMVLGAALLTKSPAIFFAILLPTTTLFLPKKQWVIKLFEAIGLWLVVYVFGFGIYNLVLRLGPGFQMIAIRNKDYVFTLKDILSHPLDPLIPHLKDLTSWLPNLLTWPIFLLALAGILMGLKKHWKISLFLLLWFILPIFIQSVFAKVFTPRYILFTIWPLIVFAAIFLNWLFNRLKRPYVTGIILLIIMIPALIYDWLLLTNPGKAPLPRNLRYGHLEEWTAGQGIKEIAIFLNKRAKITNVLVGTEGFFGTLPDGLQMYLEKVPHVRIIGVGYPITKIHPSLINSLVDNEVYLVVNQSRLQIPPQAYGLKLIKEYPKAIMPSGFQDKLLFFQLDKNYRQPNEKIP